MFRDLREQSQSYRLRELASLRAKVDRLDAKEKAAKEADKNKGGEV